MTCTTDRILRIRTFWKVQSIRVLPRLLFAGDRGSTDMHWNVQKMPVNFVFGKVVDGTWNLNVTVFMSIWYPYIHTLRCSTVQSVYRDYFPLNISLQIRLSWWLSHCRSPKVCKWTDLSRIKSGRKMGVKGYKIVRKRLEWHGFSLRFEPILLEH